MKKIISQEIPDINGLIKASNNLKNNLIIEESKPIKIMFKPHGNEGNIK